MPRHQPLSKRSFHAPRCSFAASGIAASREHAAVTVLTDPETRERFRTAGAAVVADGSAELTKHIASETVMWRDLIAKAGIKVE